MDSTLLQIILAVAMLLTTAVAGFIPLKVVKILDKNGGKGRGPFILSLLSCFAGGVFMATCFLDIFPHVNHIYDEYKEAAGINISFPLPQLFTCLGFFLVYLIEEFCIKVFGVEHSHSHGGEEKEEEIEKNRRSLVLEETANYAIAEPEHSTMLKSITFAIAISFHSLLEGFALGVQDTTTGIMTLFLSLLIHKGIEAFSVGLQVSKGNQNKMKAVIITIIIYSLMTPIGSIGGLLLQISNIDPLTKDGVILILESMAAGTFIYVTFLEVLAPEKDNEHNSLVQLLAIFVGFLVITALQLVFTEETGGHGSSSATNMTTVF